MKGILHALALAVAAWVFAQPLAVAPVAGAAAGGALLGALAAEVAARQRMRLWVRLAGPLAGALAGWGVAGLVARYGLGASVWGPHVSLVWAEALRWGVTAGAAAAVLRGLALAHRPLLVLETVVVALAIAVPWASHREGMIARPLELSDWFWSHNLDPVWGFVGLGIAASMAMASLWMRPKSAGRGVLALLAVLLLALPLGWWLQRGATPASQPPPAGGGGAASGESEADASERDQRYEDQTEPSSRPKEPVAVVVLHRDVAPLGGVFYLRATAFSQFNGVRLVTATRDGVDAGVPRAFPAASPVDVPAPPDESDLRETVATDVALMVPQDRPLALSDPVRLEAQRNGSARFRRQYHVVSEVLTDAPEQLLGRPAGNPAWSFDEWEHYTALPDDPRYVELVTRLVDRLETEWSDDPWAVALAVRAYLEAETTYAFDGSYGDGGDGDPTAKFLFSEEKRGYCVHLAHSAALLLRARGIPARVSAGYAVEADRRGNGSAFLVRNVDAHAWAELYLDGVGWVPLEVVPEQVDADLTPFEEEDLQQLLGEMAREEQRLDPVATRDVDLLAWLRGAARALPALALAVVVALLAARELRGQRYRFAGPRASRWGYRSALDALALHGWRRHRGESREAFARRVEVAAPSFARLSRVFLEDRLAGRPPRASDPRVLRLTRDARAEAATSAPWWRRALAWLDPISWLLSR